MGEVAEGDPAALVGAISDQRTLHGAPHTVACRALGVSEAWFYKWRRRPAEPTKRKARRRQLVAPNVLWVGDMTEIETGEGKQVRTESQRRAELLNELERQDA